jgi:hypothetical protein
MNRQLLILRAMNDFGWSKPFATQYIMERTYNGLSHNSAFRAAMNSVYVSNKDKPKV